MSAEHSPATHAELARLGVATVYEASGREGLVEVPLTRLVPRSRVAGPARTVRCGQGDNLMVHAALAQARPGDVLVLAMPEPEPVALIGELLARQAKVRGVAALLVDAAVRDVEELVELGLPIWARHVSARGATKDTPGALGEPLVVGGATIHPGAPVVLDADGAVTIAPARVAEVLDASRARLDYEEAKRRKLDDGVLSYDLDGLRARVEGGR